MDLWHHGTVSVLRRSPVPRVTSLENFATIKRIAFDPLRTALCRSASSLGGEDPAS